MAVLAASLMSCIRTARRDNPYLVTSAELVAAGERDTAFVRQVRMVEEIAAHIPTDTLARLYVAAVAAPADRAGVYEQAIACQYFRMVWRYGSIASARAIHRMTDSLFTTPAAREQWGAAQGRWPGSASLGYSCVSDLPRGPDSLDIVPRKTVWP